MPAGKLARKGGLDFVPTPMWSNIGVGLTEHTGGLRPTCPRLSGATPEVADAIEDKVPPPPASRNRLIPDQDVTTQDGDHAGA